MLKSLAVLSRSFAAGTNGCRDLSGCWVPLKERVSLGWSRYWSSKARRASARVTPSRRSPAGYMPAKTGKLSVVVGRRHPVKMRKASMMVESIRRE